MLPELKMCFEAMTIKVNLKMDVMQPMLTFKPIFIRMLSSVSRLLQSYRLPILVCATRVIHWVLG